jgi:hypothetical protein
MAKPRDPLAGKKASVVIEMNGAAVELHDVKATDVWVVLQALLERRREAMAQYPELLPMLPEVPGGQTLFVDDGEAESAKIGFHVGD